MTKHLRAVVLSVFALLGVSFGQQTVHLPVVVEDKAGNSIRDLTAQDLQLKEEKKDQQISTLQQFQPITLNGADGQQRRPLFLLLDMVGFQAARTKEVVGEVLQYTSDALDKGEMVTLLIVDTNGMKSIHEFNKPPQVFFAALKKADGETKVLGGRYNKDVPADVTQKYAKDIADEAAAIKSITQLTYATLFPYGSYFPYIQAQLNAFKAIAVALRQTPGRKQVIWFTAAFEWNPNEIESRLETRAMPAVGGIRSGDLKPVTIEYQRTIARLNQAHISVYAANPGGDSWVNESLQRFSQATGGTRFGYAHDPGRVVREAAKACQTYYMIEYQPNDAVENLRFNKLKLTSAKADHVTAPEGRFATPPQEWND